MKKPEPKIDYEKNKIAKPDPEMRDTLRTTEMKIDKDTKSNLEGESIL